MEPQQQKCHCNLLSHQNQPPLPFSRAFVVLLIVCFYLSLRLMYTYFVCCLVTFSNRANLFYRCTADCCVPTIFSFPLPTKRIFVQTQGSRRFLCKSFTLFFPTRQLLCIQQQPFDLAHVGVVLPVRHFQLPHRLAQVGQSLSWFLDVD